MNKLPLIIFSALCIGVLSFSYDRYHSSKTAAGSATASTHNKALNNGTANSRKTDGIHHSTMPAADALRGPEQLDKLLKQSLTPAMKREINQALTQEIEQSELIQTSNGSYIRHLPRYSSVTVAVINEQDELVVTDITSPINELTENEKQ